ncbi:class I SAM-dependent methyltransferase [Micromonospora sp. LOL_024]|uniref:class I SAM-dependent methyltransferase n=1 Tax=Micromonospora sp. LOL_024 TaxID=3345412 RepID=UPI003A8532CE
MVRHPCTGDAQSGGMIECRSACVAGICHVGDSWFYVDVHNDVGITAYLVNESRARREDLAADPLAREWISGEQRGAVRGMWDEFAESVYPHDDLVVSLRGRIILETLTQALEKRSDTVLVVCGAGFSSYPWLLPFAAAMEVDLPNIVATKRRRVAELRAAGVLDQRDVDQIATDLNDPEARRRLLGRIRQFAAGRPIAYVAEGLIFYLPPDGARAVVGLGVSAGPDTLTMVSYWPFSTMDHPVLSAQRRWFRKRSVPEDATYLTTSDLSTIVGSPVDNHSPEDLQRRYLGAVVVPETELIPEHVAVARL